MLPYRYSFPHVAIVLRLLYTLPCIYITPKGELDDAVYLKITIKN